MDAVINQWLLQSTVSSPQQSSRCSCYHSGLHVITIYRNVANGDLALRLTRRSPMHAVRPLKQDGVRTGFGGMVTNPVIETKLEGRRTGELDAICDTCGKARVRVSRPEAAASAAHPRPFPSGEHMGLV